MGQTTFGEPLNYKVSQNAAAIEADEEAMAILATGDTHIAIGAGKYVYVRDHSTLARGLYKNTSGSTIAANDPLSSSNLTATTEGGLNELNSKIDNSPSVVYNFYQNTAWGGYYTAPQTMIAILLISSFGGQTNNGNSGMYLLILSDSGYSVKPISAANGVTVSVNGRTVTINCNNPYTSAKIFAF